MTQCRGTTQKGERCRREAAEGSEYCSLHEAQSGGDDSASGTEWDVDAIVKTAIGFALIGAIVLFRIRR